MRPTLSLVRTLSIALLALLTPARLAAAEEPWPNKRILLIVPFGVASATDVVGRFMADAMKDIIGQPFVVENRGGAGGTLGANAVAKAAPDGYTLLLGGNTTHSAAPALIKSVPYDPIKDFTPIARIGKYSSAVITNPQMPFRSMQGLVAYAKANPGKITYGHGNSTGQIVGETLKKRLGLDMVRLSYPSTAPGVTDVMTNTIQMMVGDTRGSRELAEAGKLFALATIARERTALMPDTPTLHETVMPGFEVLPWVALFGPAGLPPEITDRLAKAVETIMKRPDIPKRFESLGTEPFYLGGRAFTEFVKADLPVWKASAAEAGIEPQ